MARLTPSDLDKKCPDLPLVDFDFKKLARLTPRDFDKKWPDLPLVDLIEKKLPDLPLVILINNGKTYPL